MACSKLDKACRQISYHLVTLESSVITVAQLLRLFWMSCSIATLNAEGNLL
ncbi:hypothetical protein BDV18DRAFT_8165 [Aspergillus unguis]